MLPKRDLGPRCLIGICLGLFGGLWGYDLFSPRTTSLLPAATVTMIGVAGSVPYVGAWLNQSDLSDSAIWVAARWGLLGVLIPGGLVIALILAGIRPRIA